MPIFFIYNCNWKFDLLVSAPCSIILSVMTIQRSYANKEDNVSCFQHPDEVASTMSQISTSQLIVVGILVYIYRKNTIERFIDEEMQRKQ